MSTPVVPEFHPGTIIRRYKRFLADIELPDGSLVTAHCPNTGSMTGCWEPGRPVQLSYNDNPKRKLRWTLERVDMGGGWIGVNTGRVNSVIAGFIERGQIADLAGYSELKREPAFEAEGHPRSRFDLLLRGDGVADCYVEIKNTTLYREGHIQFPDAVTSRGLKHLRLLRVAAGRGHRAAILFAVNRPEGKRFSAAADIDPDYAAELALGRERGVEIIAFRIRHTASGFEPGGALPVAL